MDMNKMMSKLMKLRKEEIMIYINILTKDEYLVMPYNVDGLPGLVSITHLKTEGKPYLVDKRVMLEEELEKQLYIIPQMVKYLIFK